MISINIAPVEELYAVNPFWTIILIFIFYIGIVIYLFSALICVYIDTYRKTIIDMGYPEEGDFFTMDKYNEFIYWIDPTENILIGPKYCNSKSALTELKKSISNK